MKQFIILPVFVFIFSLTGKGQLNIYDSLRIKDLKTQLAKASGTAEIDLLNDLAWEYGWAFKDNHPAFKRSIYASQAKDKALQLNYKRGLGYALVALSWNNYSSNKSTDSMINAAIAIGENQKDYRLLGRCYHRRWDMKKALEYFKKAGDIQGEAEAVTWLCDEYSRKGQYDNGFNYCQRAVELANVKKKYTPSYSLYISSLTFEIMSILFSKVGDYQTAFQYLKEAEKYAVKTGSDVNQSIAELYKQMGKYDSSVLYYEKALQKYTDNGKLSRQVGTANFLAKNYHRAIELLEKGLKGERDPNFKWQLPVNWRGSQHLELAESYHALNDNERANEHYLAALNYQQPEYYKLLNEVDQYKTEYQKTNQLMEISFGLSKSFYGLRKIDSAYKFLEKYTEYKDQVNNLNTAWRLNMQLSNYKKAIEDQKHTSQLQLLNKDNQLKQTKLKQETLVKNSLAIGILLLLLISVFTFRTLHFKRKSERLRRIQLENELKVKELESKQEQTALRQKATELEMQALRAQMNPHFIFNCLSSINRFILKNEIEIASDYLTRFSRLIRMVLIHSQKSLISLEDELEILKLYLDMERLRFKDAFDYNIIFTNRIDAGAVYIPPLLLQPFCENAIWHGLMHKEEKGNLNIALSLENRVLHCCISDDGIGREKASQFKSKSAEKDKSLGLKITTERLALLNGENTISTFYEINDILDEDEHVVGTRVDLKIKYRESMQEYI